MTRTQALLFVAGAALTSSAMAQNAGMDQDRAYQAELLADAGNRSSLLAQAGNAGWSSETGGFFIGDGTGNNTLQIGGDTEFRYNMSIRDDASVGDNEDFTQGFGTGFTRLRFMGNIWSKDFQYKIQLTNDGQAGDSGFALEDAWGMYNFGNEFSLGFGQAKVPLIWQDYGIDVPFVLGVERAIATQVFAPGYTQGIWGTYAADMFRVTGAISDGAAAANTPFNSSAESDYAITARVDVKAMGSDWNRFSDETSFQSQTEMALRVGGGVHFQDGGETGGTIDQQIFVYTLDAQIEGGGWNAFGAFYGSTIDTGGATDTDLFGGILQGGIFVTDQVELFARWNAIFFDSSAAAGGADDDCHFAEAGVTYYVSPESHAFKVSFFGGYAFNDTTPLFGAGGLLEGSTRSGFLGDTEDGEIVLGAEASILF
jgi:hypothetical protein